MNQRRLIGAENLKMGGRMKKVIRPLCKTTSDNPKYHLHIPQLKKGIYVLNIII
jgi:hypothetical protein